MKKSIYLLIFVSNLLISCGGPSINYNEEREYIEEKKGIVYYKGSPFSGEFKYYYKQHLGEIQNYKEGKLDGLNETYYENGQIKHDLNFKDGELDGENISYFENGQLKSKENYEQGYNVNTENQIQLTLVYNFKVT